jgi:hypothetical protein
MIPQAIRVEAAGSLAGQIIGDTSAAPQCTTCGAHLFAETEVTGYAYRFTYERNLSLARLYCNECERNPLAHPTLGAHEIVIRMMLRQRHGNLLVEDPTVVAYVAPSGGTEC